MIRQHLGTVMARIPVVCTHGKLRHHPLCRWCGVCAIMRIPVLANVQSCHTHVCRVARQLYLNAMIRKHNVCLQDLGTAFNLPGTQACHLLFCSEPPPPTHTVLTPNKLSHAGER